MEKVEEENVPQEKSLTLIADKDGFRMVQNNVNKLEMLGMLEYFNEAFKTSMIFPEAYPANETKVNENENK